MALPRLRAAGFVVRDLQGADAGEALALARQCVADGLETLVVCGGDGMVHLAAQALAGIRDPTGRHPGGHRQRRGPLPRPPAQGPSGGRRAWSSPDGRARSTWPAAARRTSSPSWRPGFDAIVNERANKMTWPRGQMRYNLATLAELRVFKPLSYTLELDGVVREVEAMLVAVGNGPSFGGGLRITEGALLDDGLLDVVIIKTMSKPDLVRTYPKLFSGTHTTHPKYELHRVAKVTVAAPGIVSYADGERFGALPLTIECAPGALTVLQ